MKFFLKRIVFGIIFITLLVVIVGIARGYRLSLSQQTVRSTGILVASSSPDGAKILVNNQLKGATNTNITVEPGIYTIKIEKDGYSSWQKKLSIKGELVIKVDALLFPKNPSLSPVTSLGVVKAFASKSSDKIILLTQSGDPEKDGIYVLDNSRNPLSIVNPIKLLVLKNSFLQNFEFANVQVEFSPDEQELLVSVYNPNDDTPQAIYLIASDDETTQPFDITRSVQTIKSAWVTEQTKITLKILETYDKPFAQIASDSFKIIALSPDEEKILYSPMKDVELPIIIKPRLIATNQTPEVRDLKKGAVYVYDKKEDKNFEIFSTEEISNFIFWYPTSNHLVIKKEDSIAVVDYDGTNERTVYSGPFQSDFFTTSKDGKLFVLSNLNAQTTTLPDVYTVGIR
ncbi:hypothetical protein A3H80_04355 [Candidatus Roizmanbacteria bacterium RIFCSPLOWO2_02_FULL_37_19]|uniref:PEGA domain-containing protein n=1 Tax=Candidatus Roizmanbacteria bacterium RIFCSPHIGHO2_02_FULL_37_24 TaxID=1802037 RepID=A0A1F7GW36_9BACT|nr:MAG: hypothetical protein A2862_03985 [Candidatus Roizmanbacteria bacterium RIFCSPHIGHO2_01_FULL_38_41]OGK23121.1 MAG: hypothetical protein A3C24_01385 [Candidatus Roizmanbacteria bacterium RIFCSPHIGHO2_02_FULL_37_24]OGK32844.1 MAG: hypothetical protein A3E10_00045 [Candidatus Roizmanbacteria bacterium RIFCSPHIGHO2_12_FULL_37_23]OGK45479.1 MAG: hypothetical protein A2956_00115 [Candidatus Roizmanbacteria bacterium RIFCSPLOWO2_01_FULL_37_57]OGK54257.1 MAG: hypothetical protein A3H80_04355 [Ca